MPGTDDGLKIFLVVVVLTVPKFDGSNLPLLCIKAEVIVQTPPIIAQAFLNFETWRHFVVIAGHIGHFDTGQEVGLSIGIVGFGEHPRELETGLDDDD